MDKVNCSSVHKINGSTIKLSNKSKFEKTPRHYITPLNRDPNLVSNKKNLENVIVKSQLLQAIYLHKTAEKHLQIKEKACLMVIENYWQESNTLADDLNKKKILVQKYKYYINELNKLNCMKKIVEPTLTKIRAIYNSLKFIVFNIQQHLSTLNLTGLSPQFVPILTEIFEYGSKVQSDENFLTYQEFVLPLYSQLHLLETLKQKLNSLKKKEEELLPEYIDVQNELKKLKKIEQKHKQD